MRVGARQDTYGASIMLPGRNQVYLGVVGRVRDRRLGFADEFEMLFRPIWVLGGADRPEGILRPRDVDSAWKESSIRIRRQDLATFSDEMKEQKYRGKVAVGSLREPHKLG